MVHDMLRLMCLLLFIPVASSCSAGNGSNVGNEAAVRKFPSGAFMEARDERNRLLIAIQVLETGSIRKGGKVLAVDEAFGTHFDEQRLQMRPGDTTWGTIEFGESSPEHHDNEGRGHSGWYFAVEFTDKGTILDYLITNASK
jgi:hypothetical protein